VSLEVVPDLLHWVELWSVAGKVYKLKARELLLNRSDDRPPVNAAVVPYNDDVSSKVPQENAQEFGRVACCEIGWLKAYVEAEPLVASRYGERSKSGDTVVTIVVANDRRLTGDSPGPATTRNEQEAAFIEEGEVGPKSLPFFLAQATCTASSSRLPLRRVGLLFSPELGSSSPTDAEASIRDQRRNGPGTPSESRVRSASVSRCRSGTPKQLLPAAEYRIADDIDLDGVSEGGLVRASEPVLSRHLPLVSAAIDEPKRLTHQFVAPPPKDSNHSKEGKRPFADGVPVPLGSHAVS